MSLHASDGKFAVQTVANFWSRVRKTDSCWLWMGTLSHNGYGRTSEGGRGLQAHRYIYERSIGPIPAGLHVCHSCDVRNCVNPAHLFLGTAAENIADKVRKGRQARGERVAKAKLTADQVRTIRSEHASGKTQKELALQFGVSQPAIGCIVRREVWRVA